MTSAVWYGPNGPVSMRDVKPAVVREPMRRRPAPYLSEKTYRKLVTDTIPTMWAGGFNSAEIARHLMNLHPDTWASYAEAEVDVLRMRAEHRGGERG